MKELFDLSVAMLWGLVILEAVIFIHVLRRSTSIRQLDFSRLTRDQLPDGSAVPAFTANLAEGGILTSESLKGHSTTILFLSPDDFQAVPAGKLSVAIHALWHKAMGHLYLTCGDSGPRCRQLIEEFAREGLHLAHVPLIIDENKLLASSFLISSTPRAVMLDAEAKVSRYGHVLSEMEASDDVSTRNTLLAR